MFTTLQQRFAAWALRRQRYDHGAILLTQRSIYIIPTRQGVMLVLVLILMLLGDINYNLSLGYVLTFLLAMMAVMSMLHAFRNLAHLEIRPGRADAVFCGETAHFLLHFRNGGKLPRYQLCLRESEGDGIPSREKLSREIRTGNFIGKIAALRLWRRGSEPRIVCFDLPAQQDSVVAFPITAVKRGWLETGRLTLHTEFPLGLFYSWSYLHFDTRCLVYPKPLSDAPLPFGNSPGGTGKRNINGDDDFTGLRTYVAGDALPRISWKAYARERGLQVKQFATPVGEELWLDFADTPDRSGEEKLSRMARWVLDAEEQGLRYGLRLPGGELPPDNGKAQRDECLRRIALFNLP
ncbi:MAG: DUF58 domain-containing protein [Gallionella sp.]|nr:DUF58 domain-containing protein [Gallionella sp.]